jgi:hypothetical protein
VSKTTWIAIVVGVGVTALLLGLVGGAAIGSEAFPKSSPSPYPSASPSPSPIQVAYTPAECALAFQYANAAFKQWTNLVVAFSDNQTATAQLASYRATADEKKFHAEAAQCKQSGSR